MGNVELDVHVEPRALDKGTADKLLCPTEGPRGPFVCCLAAQDGMDIAMKHLCVDVVEGSSSQMKLRGVSSAKKDCKDSNGGPVLRPTNVLPFRQEKLG